jgi:RNA polymerase sigma factor (sigma-70 family)
MNSAYRRACAGDSVAVGRVVELLRPRVTRLAAHYARRTGELTDDLLQEAWLGLLEALPTLDLSIGSPDQYLLRHARWRLLDSVRRVRLRRMAPLEDVLLETLTASEIDGGDLASAWVLEFAQDLKATQRAVLDCLLRGLTWREAGDALGCTSSNVAWHVRQIQRRYEAWTAEAI